MSLCDLTVKRWMCRFRSTSNRYTCIYLYMQINVVYLL